MMFYVMAFGWAMTSIQFLSGPGIIEVGQLTLNGWLGIGFLGVFCSGLAYVFWYDALQIIPASQVGVLLYLEPVVTASSGELASFASFYVAQMYLYLEDNENSLKFSSRAQKLSVSSSLTMIRAVACESAAFYLEGKDRKAQRIVMKEIEGIYGRPSYLLEMTKVLVSSGVEYE